MTFLLFTSCSAEVPVVSDEIQTGADQIDVWYPLLAGKRVALVGNQTSEINGVHLVDTLISLGIRPVKVFSPEHGFRGKADAGQLIPDGKDSITGIDVVSLYGDHKKPTALDLADVDIIVFDIQDVGARFYTYISTMHYVMEACAENGKMFIVLDRPNPNGNYIDGPVLEPKNQSFVGMHPVPVVHGMTIGEYARMINGEGWLKAGMQCDLRIIPCLHYDHSKEYILPVQPSPNLPNQEAIYLYPSLAFFEGTVISVARGTLFPFQAFGHPELLAGDFYFVPESTPGASLNPPLKNQKCRGIDLRKFSFENDRPDSLRLDWLIWAYNNISEKDKFFNNFFIKLSGTADLQAQIQSGMPENEIRESWEPKLSAFKEIRDKYLLYN